MPPSLAAGLAVCYQPRVVRSPAAHAPGVRVGRSCHTQPTRPWESPVRSARTAKTHCGGNLTATACHWQPSPSRSTSSLRPTAPTRKHLALANNHLLRSRRPRPKPASAPSPSMLRPRHTSRRGRSARPPSSPRSAWSRRERPRCAARTRAPGTASTRLITGGGHGARSTASTGRSSTS